MAGMARRRPPPALDFLSPPDVFDPKLALTAEEAAVPFDDIRPLDNLAKCVHLLPGAAAAPAAARSRSTTCSAFAAGSRRQAPATAQRSSSSAEAHGISAAAMAQHGASCSEAHFISAAVCAPCSSLALPTAFGRSTRESDSSCDAPRAARDERNVPEAKKSLAQQWAESFRGEGPLGEAGLGRWRWRRVRVVVRRQYGVRGWYEGALATYDRHWNMLLTDVTEQTVAGHHPPPSAGDAAADALPRCGGDGGGGVGGPSGGGGFGAPGRPRSPAATAWKRTSIPQLLLRGDTVVSVCDARKAADAAVRSQNCSYEHGQARAGGAAGGPGLIAAAFERLGLAALEMARVANEQRSPHDGDG